MKKINRRSFLAAADCLRRFRLQHRFFHCKQCSFFRGCFHQRCR